MKILVINAGSSSLKYQLIDMATKTALAKGNCERIGDESVLTHKTADGRQTVLEQAMPTHSEAFSAVIDCLTKGEAKVIDGLSEISAVGHRVVQGGAKFTQSMLVNEEVLKEIEALSPLAPLHNPANVLGIRACWNVLGKEVPQVAVFDTSFHTTMPEKAYLYGVPYKYYEKYGVRRYGFHGTSHRYVSAKVAELMGRDIKDLKIICCHLGNGASITAVQNGQSVDTTMGFTPLDGFMMGTRSGALDPSVVTFIAEKEGMTPAEMDKMLNKESGVLGITEYSNDNRDVTAAAQNGNARCALALDMQRYQITKYIGGFVAAMNGVDAIAFTGGMGENNADLREEICENFGYLGIEIDKPFNNEHAHIRGKDLKISTEASKVAVFAVSTDEEMVIAEDTLALIQ